MNDYIKSYIKQATIFFPIVGKAEQLFLSQLSRSMEDFFSEAEPDSLNVVIQVFGPPQSVVNNYLTHSDIQHVAKRIRMRNFVRYFIITILAICLMVALLIAVHFGSQLYALHEIEGYDPPIYSSDGTLPEE